MITPQKVGCWGLVALTLFAGCVPSLNAVYTNENLVFDPAVVGVWLQPGSKATWDFSKRDDTSYRLIYTDKDGHTGVFTAHLANVEGTLFLDLYPEQVPIEANSFYKFHLVPIHTIYLVRRTEPALELAAINYQWLEKYLTEHPHAIPFATFDGRKMLTAPTADVQAFVLEHKQMFSGDFNLQRQTASVD
jgi:hypothetical protein